MYYFLQPALAFFTLLPGLYSPGTDPCAEASTGAADAAVFCRDSVYINAFNGIRQACQSDQKEHVVVFGRDEQHKVISSVITDGTASSGTLKPVNRAFADLHNHPNDTPPDAGDLYGLLDINLQYPAHASRYVVTKSSVVYLLLVTNPGAAKAFNKVCPRQLPAANGLQPSFPAAVVDEFRELKYRYACTDETAMAFILEKYNAGISLLKQFDNGDFKKIRTVAINTSDGLRFSEIYCE